MMLVSREGEPGNWNNRMHFSFHFGSVEQAPFFCLHMVVEAVKGRAVPSLWLHSPGQSNSVKQPLQADLAGSAFSVQTEQMALLLKQPHFNLFSAFLFTLGIKC